MHTAQLRKAQHMLRDNDGKIDNQVASIACDIEQPSGSNDKKRWHQLMRSDLKGGHLPGNAMVLHNIQSASLSHKRVEGKRGT